MGKFKRIQDEKQKHTNHHDDPSRSKSGIVRRQYSQQHPKSVKKKTASNGSEKASAALQKRQQQAKIIVPFTKGDRVLLVGEGDFSFALSLAQNYEVTSITATCFDNEVVLKEKYPDVSRTIGKLLQSKLVSNSKDVLGEQNDDVITRNEDSNWNGFSSDSSLNDDTSSARMEAHNKLLTSRVSIFYGIDATKLSTLHKKAIKAHGPFTKIVFNFPHVGGISTDVNRQVRANQELLVGFFKAAKQLLATSSNPVKSLEILAELSDADKDDKHEDMEETTDDQDDVQTQPVADIPSAILLTLFTSHPYTLWNPRDLGRHCDLRVIESYRFNRASYPGYQHARTIGDITHGEDRSAEGKRLGAWRGEEREARCYVFGLKDEVIAHADSAASRKRKQCGDDSDSE